MLLVGCIALLALVCVNVRVGLFVVGLTVLGWHASRRCAPPSASRSRERSARHAAERSARHAAERPPATGASAESGDDSEAPADVPFPRLNELSVVRLRPPAPSPAVPRTVEDEQACRGGEPNMRKLYTESRTKLQQAMADELTSRDPAIRPIRGKFGCKPSLGTL